MKLSKYQTSDRGKSSSNLGVLMKKSAALCVISAALVGGCAYNVAPTTAPAVNVYSSYESKIPGSWVLVIDPSTEFQREIKPSTYVCSAHKYPFSSGDTIKSSISQTMGNIFEEVISRSSAPTSEELAKNSLAGVVIVRLDSFQPRLACQQGFWSASCSATADMSFGVEVNGPNGRMLGTSVGSSKTHDGDAGGACGDAANVFAEAYRLSLKDSLERMAERVANAPKLRGKSEN
jgi:hypothetical protein